MVEHPSILLIEDEPRLRQNLQILLHSEGYAVATAENGTEGIQRLQETPFDLVITDVVMPETDGFQVMEYLKDHRPDTVVVAITAYVSTASAIEALRKGAYDYLAKPFDVDLMLIVIRRALEKARMQKAFRHHMGELERQVEERTRKLTAANIRLEQLPGGSSARRSSWSKPNSVPWGSSLLSWPMSCTSRWPRLSTSPSYWPGWHLPRGG